MAMAESISTRETNIMKILLLKRLIKIFDVWRSFKRSEEIPRGEDLRSQQRCRSMKALEHSDDEG